MVDDFETRGRAAILLGILSIFAVFARWVKSIWVRKGRLGIGG